LQPLFSVVIPSFKRPVQLRKCLHALARQRLPRDEFEVIVTDDGAFLRSREWQAEFRDGLGLDLTVLSQPRAGPARARNRAVLCARGDLLAFTDDDCEPAEEWLASLKPFLRAHPQCLVGGHVVNALPRNPCSTASQLLVDFLYSFYTANGVPRFFTSNNFALSRRGFESIGGFSQSFPLTGEDREFCARWASSGRPVQYLPEAVVFHAHALTPFGFVRQHFRYGRSAWTFHRVCRRHGWLSARLEPPIFYFRLVSYPLRNGGGDWFTRLQQSGLFAVSQAANAAGFLCEVLGGPFEPG